MFDELSKSNMLNKEEAELVNLPEEWIYEMQHQKKDMVIREGVNHNSSFQLSRGMENVDNISVEVSRLGPTTEILHMQSSQPTVEDLKKAKLAGRQRSKRLVKKQQWGLVFSLRRSSRNIDDGRTMLDKG